MMKRIYDEQDVERLRLSWAKKPVEFTCDCRGVGTLATLVNASMTSPVESLQWSSIGANEIFFICKFTERVHRNSPEKLGSPRTQESSELLVHRGMKPFFSFGLQVRD